MSFSARRAKVTTVATMVLAAAALSLPALPASADGPPLELAVGLGSVSPVHAGETTEFPVQVGNLSGSDMTGYDLAITFQRSRRAQSLSPRKTRALRAMTGRTRSRVIAIRYSRPTPSQVTQQTFSR